jgi:antitoxin Phd
MNLETSSLIAMTEANQNFSKVVRLVDEKGAVVILKHNKPKYAVLTFSEYNNIQEKKKATLKKMANQLMSDNMTAFETLAKC